MRRRRSLAHPWAAGALAAATLVLPMTIPTPPATAADAASATATSATVFYYTKTKNWSDHYLHYAPDGGPWTTVPGTQMQTACTDWVKLTADLGSAAGLQATFTNGNGVWDNNGGRNYALATGNITVKDGVVAHSDPCADSGAGSGNEATVYYSTQTLGWTTANLHYQPAGGTWTTVPGVGMEAACTGWWKKTVDIGSATSLKAAFNNGNGVWDNNNGSDYTIASGTSTVKDNTVTADAKDPCAAEEPDTEAPSTPGAVRASATKTSVVVSWDAATDDTGVTKYQLTRTGGTKGTTVIDVASTVHSDTGLEEDTTYSYTVTPTPRA